MKRVVLALMMVLAVAASARADTAAGYDAIDRGDYEAALRIFEGLAAEGDAQAIFALGWMHARGVGVRQDDRAAARLFARAADLGDAEAQNALGYAYEFALGVPLDPIAARLWYRRAADHGLRVAKNNLAYSWTMEGRNLDQALALVREVLASEPDHPAYLDTLGSIYYRLGRYREAVPPLCRAAELEPGHPEIALHLGDALWRAGHVVEARQAWRRVLDLSTSPRDLSVTGRDYLAVHDDPAWRGMLAARIATGLSGAAAARAKLPLECAVPIS